MIRKEPQPPRQTRHFCNSMLPLLQNRDILDITRVSEVQKGDIVIFKGKEAGKWIVHRVVKIQKSFMLTKGDNNPQMDKELLRIDEIAGIVTARWRNGKRLRIFRGKMGILQMYSYHTYKLIRNFFANTVARTVLPKPLSKILSEMLPPIKEVKFTKENDIKRILYMGKKPIGTYSDYHCRWQIRFPWRMVYEGYCNKKQKPLG